MSADHLLHLDGLDEGGHPIFRLTCEHDDKHEFCTKFPDHYGECWVQPWWRDLGREALDAMPGPLIWPIPVRPRVDGEDVWLERDEQHELRPLNLTPERREALGMEPAPAATTQVDGRTYAVDGMGQSVHYPPRGEAFEKAYPS